MVRIRSASIVLVGRSRFLLRPGLRGWWNLSVLSATLIMTGAAVAPAADLQIQVGSRLELLVDDFLIARMDGARLVLHHPIPGELALAFDAPWEGNASLYHSIFQDGELYRMYYYGGQMTVADGKLTLAHPFVTCYAESNDGIHWRKPELGLVEFNGSKRNNIVLATGRLGNVEIDAAHIAVFKDENPQCPPEARYKAIIRPVKVHGLLVLRSPDGLHWTPMSDEPVITKGAFDSQNLAFWDPVRSEYRAYFRYFVEKRRDILTATSNDCLHWSEPAPLEYPGAPKDELYTNQIKPYYRAPHLFVGFPTRYVERGWSESMQALPESENRRQRSAVEPRFGMALTEGLLMTSRDGRTFRRWGEAFLRPGPERPGTWNYGHQYIGWHAVETASSLPGGPRELSLYASEGYWTGSSCELRRYTLRLDGFVSAQAPLSGGELVTKPLVFQGSRLQLNFSTSAAGSIRIEIQDEQGKPLPGLALADCPQIFGDAIERTVVWKGGRDLAGLAGKPVCLRFELKDADLFAFRFR